MLKGFLMFGEFGKEQHDSAYALLFRGWQSCFPGEAMPEIHRNKDGKPCFACDGRYFSLSHTKNAILCVISDHEVGADAETLRPLKEGLLRRICSEGEFEWAVRQPEPNVAAMTLWTLKESYYKYLGTGLPGIPNRTEFSWDGGWHLKGSPCRFATATVENCVVSVCTEAEIPEHWLTILQK